MSQIAMFANPCGEDISWQPGQEKARKTFWETTTRQLRPILARLRHRLHGGHWVEPCAGRGVIPRLCAEILPELGRPLPVCWTLYEIADAEAALLALPGHVTSIGEPGMRVQSPMDFLALDNGHAGKDVAMVVTNLPWPEPGLGIVRKAFDLYPHADVLALCDMLPILRDWRTEGGPRAEWLAEHQPDWYVLPGRNSGARALTFEGASNELATALAWMHWPVGQRDRTQGTMEILRP
jgi:hypothetical protein